MDWITKFKEKKPLWSFVSNTTSSKPPAPPPQTKKNNLPNGPNEPYSFLGSFPEIMLGKCDAVHSGAAMAFVAVGIVGLTVVSTLGLMGYFQVPNGSLAKKIGEATGEAVETQKMIKDNKYNKLKRRSQEKKKYLLRKNQGS